MTVPVAVWPSRVKVRSVLIRLKEFTELVAVWPANVWRVTGKASTDPNAVVEDRPVNKCVGLDVISTAPTEEVTDNPDRPITSAGVKAPTALVDDKPDRPTEWSSSDNKPSEETKPKFGRVIVAFVETDAKEFTEAVALKPVKPTTSAGVTVPKDVVADKPDILNTADSTVPHPFSPQSKVPQPGFVSTVKAPIEVVADKPVSVRIGVSPQAWWPPV